MGRREGMFDNLHDGPVTCIGAWVSQHFGIAAARALDWARFSRLTSCFPYIISSFGEPDISVKILPMKALSIRQPYAWLIVNGVKDVENRSWSTKYRGVFYVHAAQTLDGTRAERERLRRWVRQRFDVIVPDDEDLPRGGIVGRAALVHVTTKSRSPWHVAGHYGLVLVDARPLRFRRHRGKLGFFSL